MQHFCFLTAWLVTTVSYGSVLHVPQTPSAGLWHAPTTAIDIMRGWRGGGGGGGVGDCQTDRMLLVLKWQ